MVGSSAGAVADARRLVESTFPDIDVSVVEDLRLIVTELLTNALLHGEPPVVLRLRVEDGEALVDIDLVAENQRSEITAKGSATIALPRRGD